MNFSQKLGLFILILITIAYIYFSFINKSGFDFIENDHQTDLENFEEFNPIDNVSPPIEDIQQEVSNKNIKKVKIFILDEKGSLRSVNRECDTAKETSCFEFAMRELVNAPSKWEKSKGFSSEIPQGTKVLSIRESAGNILVDLSSTFESGGGAESTYTKINQVIKTANANTKLPVFLYINGKQANVIGGEGVMIKQPLNERSLDE